MQATMASEEQAHLDESQIENFSRGLMSDSAARHWEEHLLLCEPCRQELARSDAYQESMRHAAQRARLEVERPRNPFFFMRLVPVLSAALIILVAGVALRHRPSGAAAPETVTLEAKRGGSGLVAEVSAGRPLLIKPGLEGVRSVPEYHLQIVDREGKRIWEGNFQREAGAITPQLTAGIYFVRLFDVPGTLLREYVMEVKSGQQ